jgi:hypothetical protein
VSRKPLVSPEALASIALGRFWAYSVAKVDACRAVRTIEAGWRFAANSRRQSPMNVPHHLQIHAVVADAGRPQTENLLRYDERATRELGARFLSPREKPIARGRLTPTSLRTPSNEQSFDTIMASRLDQPERLDALHQTGLLDSPPEESFDRIGRIAQRLLGAPVALVALVEQNRQFFKSVIGLSGPGALARETPLTHSFCQHVVTSDEPLIVNDASSYEVCQRVRISPTGFYR